MRVSIVIPTFNRETSVMAAVESVLRQTFTDFEVVVVDDGSTDGTAARIAAIADARVRYVHQTNAGVSAARNLGVRVARGDILSFLDSDDLWMPDKLAHEVAFLDARPDAGAVFSDLVKYDGDRVVPSFMRASPVFAGMLALRLRDASVVFEQREMLLCLLQEVPILPSAFTLRRVAFVAAGGFDETWRAWEDWEFFLRLARQVRFGYIDRPLAAHRLSADSLHRVEATHGRTRMLARLRSVRRELRGDSEAWVAATNGLIGLRNRIAWDYADAGQRLAALATYVTGFAETGRASVLLRALAALLPRAVRHSGGRLLRAAART